MATPENCSGALKYWGCTGTLLAEVGLPQEPVSQIRERMLGEPLRLVWNGQHTPGKALNLLLLAARGLPADVNWELHILGNGRQTVAWQRLANRLGIDERCHFHGWVPRERALEVMRTGHLSLITSLRDLTSTVTVEALAFGVPIICLDHCGFADVVTECCGIKIPVTTPGEVVAAMGHAIEQLARDEARRRTLARGALDRARGFAWETKAQVVDHIYRAKVVGGGISKAGGA